MSVMHELCTVGLIVSNLDYYTSVCWILNIQSLWHVFLLLNIAASISDTNACPVVVEVQSVEFKELKKHYTVVQFVGTVWCMLPFTTTVKLQAKQRQFCTTLDINLSHIFKPGNIRKIQIIPVTQYAESVPYGSAIQVEVKCQKAIHCPRGSGYMSLKVSLPTGGSRPLDNTWFLGPTWVWSTLPLNSISTGSAILQRSQSWHRQTTELQECIKKYPHLAKRVALQANNMAGIRP